MLNLKEKNFKNVKIKNFTDNKMHRSNVTVLEERRLIPNEIIDSIIRPFLVSRQAPFMKNPKYSEIAELREEPQEIIISSAHYKSYEWYPETKKFLKMIADGDTNTKALFLDYPISIHHGIKTKNQMIRERSNMDPITFLMEYGNIPYGSSSYRSTNLVYSKEV